MRRIARLLRIQLAERQVPIGDIAATGLGYANLLYIAMIVLQLVRARESDLTLLLVEEPEAHLHPQLQLVLLDFLHSHAKSSGNPTPGLNAVGKVQVIVTTHSPVLASSVSVNNVVVVARHGEHDDWCTKAIAIADLGLKDVDRRKIDRYLNSTRSALLFARDVVLVEGIAEMLVLPVCAERHLVERTAAEPAANGDTSTDNYEPALDTREREGPVNSDDDSKYLAASPSENRSRKALRQFRSATLINVEGVDFEPYLRVLLDGDHPRVDRVVVVTDRDHTGAGDMRKTHYEELFQRDVEAGRLKVVVGGTTLEAEIFRLAENEKVLKSSFLKLHPQSDHHWDNVVAKAKNLTQDQRAELFAKAIRAESAQDEVYLDIAKGDFAHVVAEALEQSEETELVVPDYLRQAIEAVAHVEPHGDE